LYLLRFLRKHSAVRTIILLVIGIFVIIAQTAGLQVALQVVAMVGQFAFAAAFMVGQFLFLFLFLARSRTLTVEPGVGEGKTLADYRGQPALVEIMGQWITILKGDKQFKAMGGDPPRGILLVGPPGTGKTFLMKCLSGTAAVAMHSIEGSSFRAMFWGVDVLKVLGFVSKARNLALKHGACIAYIDEIDSIGSSRGGVAGGAQGQMVGPAGFMGGTGALTTLLAQMDGMGEDREMTKCRNMVRGFFGLPSVNEGFILFVGATNRPDVLDPALIRPGRLDRKIAVDPPDGPGRKDVFEYYLSKVQNRDVDVERLVANTHGATPAAIEMAVTRDAVRIARFADRDYVEQADLEWALIEQVAGLANPIGDLPEEQRRQVCTHEAGHAVAQYHLLKGMKVAFVSAVRRSVGLGFMMPVHLKTTYAMPLKDIVAGIRVSMAGDVATAIVLGERWTGAASDLEHVRQRILYLAWHGVFGGLIMEQGKLTPEMSEPIQRFVNEQWDATKTLLEKHVKQVKALADALMEKSELSGDEAIRIIEEAEC
jgi:ATP-dependent Zn protease